MKISVVIPTHNRPQKLQETLEKLRRQDFPVDEYEIIIVDDGSNPPVVLGEELAAAGSAPETRLIRLEGVERSIARNTGAKSAKGELLIFVDDDVSVNGSFLSAHWQASREFPDALLVGEIILPPEKQSVPFVRFRQELERQGVPTNRGVVESNNFCTAQNMAINGGVFKNLNGFEEHLVSGEDQDLALRHTAGAGGGRRIVFVPEALGIHYDNAFDIRSYCRRNEWGSRLMQLFYERYPNLPANIERNRINGIIKWKDDSIKEILRKSLKGLIATPLVIKLLFFVADIFERISPASPFLDRIYRLLLGAHIFRGYRAALKQ